LGSKISLPFGPDATVVPPLPLSVVPVFVASPLVASLPVVSFLPVVSLPSVVSLPLVVLLSDVPSSLLAVVPLSLPLVSLLPPPPESLLHPAAMVETLAAPVATINRRRLVFFIHFTHERGNNKMYRLAYANSRQE